MKIFKIIYWWAKIVLCSFKGVTKLNLGDLVYYKGNKYTILNGDMYNHWKLADLKNTNGGYVLSSSCKKVKSFKNYIGSFTFRYRFYMKCWFNIYINR